MSTTLLPAFLPAGQDPDLILRTLSSALRRVLKRELASLTTASEATRLSSLLSADVTDVLAGRSVTLKLDRAVDEAGRAAIESFLQSVLQATKDLEPQRQEAAIAKLAEVILPDPRAEARGAVALDNLRLRDRFLAEEGVLTSAEVGERAGYRGRNPYATAARWKKAGRVFSVNHRGTEYLPGFQFRDGQPHPAIGQVLATLPGSMTSWQIAFWFVSTNGWLDDDAPKDRLDDAGALVAAARREGEEVMG